MGMVILWCLWRVLNAELLVRSGKGSTGCAVVSRRKDIQTNNMHSALHPSVRVKSVYQSQTTLAVTVRRWSTFEKLTINSESLSRRATRRLAIIKTRKKLVNSGNGQHLQRKRRWTSL